MPTNPSCDHEKDISSFTPILRPAETPFSARRMPSFSLPSPPCYKTWKPSSYFSDECSSYSTPSSTLVSFKGIPFSWERIPGIPKHQEYGGGADKKLEVDEPSCGDILLPLPPAGNSAGTAKKGHVYNQEDISPKWDPFFAALVKCSEEEEGAIKIWTKGLTKTRTLSDRFGFINFYMTSCKRSSAVSEPTTVYFPRSTSPHYLLGRPSMRS